MNHKIRAVELMAYTNQAREHEQNSSKCGCWCRNHVLFISFDEISFWEIVTNTHLTCFSHRISIKPWKKNTKMPTSCFSRVADKSFLFIYFCVVRFMKLLLFIYFHGFIITKKSKLVQSFYQLNRKKKTQKKKKWMKRHSFEQ